MYIYTYETYFEGHCEWEKKGKVINDRLLFSQSVVSDSLPPHGLQHARLPCPSPSPEACSNSCPLNRWCRAINDMAFAYELYLVGEKTFLEKKQMESKLFCPFRGYREAITSLVPLTPASLGMPHFFLLVPITQHWPFNATALQCPLVLNIHCHPKWSQILPSPQINISADDFQICLALCSGITFAVVCGAHSRGFYLLHPLHPSSSSRFHWSKNPIQPPW